ncbi:MAG TPA: DNA-directed RNA polymerase subunit alpha C-terminal domain-containing protein, partial [Phycisphaerae bacterium]|nr:DNA-directed RNA polymerase subunit alpha C-terminal domain-containing protein [Phycisphaerae bacterium]
HYLRGLIEDFGGNYEGAAEAYDQARGINPDHVAATFRLAYCQDLHGDEEAAIELYQQCVSRPPVHASVLMNLAVLHEDAGRYNEAVACLKRVLATNPNHPRARLFLKDVEASRTMYFDEDQARRIARRNAVLDIPVTDFELSVRARNCLKKMNIRTLGDLVKTTEQQLLAYKNFGETSLKEIKDMLTAKGLHLGQLLDEEEELMGARPASAAAVQNEGVLATPIGQVDLSIRARKTMETLKIRTLGDLASKTEAELLACRNFGQTSLNEVRQRLGDYGLSLREPN